jgi:heme/copper-type cytochrome/quinol oxidase subunit 2
MQRTPVVVAFGVFGAIWAILLGVLFYPFKGEQISLAAYLIGCIALTVVVVLLMLMAWAFASPESRNARPAADPARGMRGVAFWLGIIFAAVYACAIFKFGWSKAISTLAIYAAGYATILAIAFVFRRRQ